MSIPTSNTKWIPSYSCGCKGPFDVRDLLSTFKLSTLTFYVYEISISCCQWSTFCTVCRKNKLNHQDDDAMIYLNVINFKDTHMFRVCQSRSASCGERAGPALGEIRICFFISYIKAENYQGCPLAFPFPTSAPQRVVPWVTTYMAYAYRQPCVKTMSF